MSCCGSSRASAGGLRAAKRAGAFGHRDESEFRPVFAVPARNSAVKWPALLLGNGGLPVGEGREFVGAGIAATTATAGCRLCTAGPGELLRAPSTQTVQAGSWSIGPGHVRAGLIPSRKDPPAGESGDSFSGSSTWIRIWRLRHSTEKKKRKKKVDIVSFSRESRFGKYVCEVHRVSSWRKIYARRACCLRKRKESSASSCRNQCRITVKNKAVEYGKQAKAKNVSRKAGSGLPVSDAGPPAARRTRTQNAQPLLLQSEVSSSLPSGVPCARRKVTGCDHQEGRKSHLRSAILDKERRRQRLGDLARVLDLMPMQLDPPRFTGPPTTRKSELSAVQAERTTKTFKETTICQLFPFNQFSGQRSSLSSSCSSDSKYIHNQRIFHSICHSDKGVKVRDATAPDVSSKSHIYDVSGQSVCNVDPKPENKLSHFFTEKPYLCHVLAKRQQYHSYFRISWGTKRTKIFFRKAAANANSFFMGYDTNLLIETSTDTKSKFLGLSFINVFAYTAFIHHDSEDDDDDEDDINGDQKEESYFEEQPRYETQEKSHHKRFLQTEINSSSEENKTERSSHNNNLSETTTCVVVPGGYFLNAFNSTNTFASETRDKSFFHETDVRDQSFSCIQNKSKKPLLQSHRCCKDKDSNADDFGHEEIDYLSKSKRSNRKRRNSRTARYPKSTIHDYRQSKLSLFKADNPDCLSERRKARNSLGARRKRYFLFFILYLLALPLLCSTNPSAQVPSALAQKSPLSYNQDFTQHNVSSTVQQYNSINNGQQQHLHQGQQVVQERERVHPYNEYSWEVNQINPWLSACDLAGPAPADLQGSCGPPEVPKNCPFSCTLKSPGDSNVAFREVIERFELVSGKIKRKKSRSWNAMKRSTEVEEEEDISENGADRSGRKSRADTSPGMRTAPEQCLFYLEESHKRDICRDDFGRGSSRTFSTPRENRYWFTSGLRLRHCCEHAVVNALTPGKDGPLEDVLNGGRKCVDALDKLLLVDALAARLHCEFEEVLARYDCGQSYSVIHNCTHCKVSPNIFLPYQA